ncbi:MAG TPA: FMN-binding protein [Bacillota bacterium]|nr:FMN-binding protein [Bacillota bacterium]HQE02161.1 FMN-binding protein [Bacillota bacterium]
MKKALKIAGLLVLALAVTVTAALWSSIRELKKLAAEEILAPDLSDAADGTWRGRTDWKLIQVELDVTVRDGEITCIELIKHVNGRGAKAEAILDRILAAQSTDVDVISGATFSSRAILHAVADALNNSK